VLQRRAVKAIARSFREIFRKSERLRPHSDPETGIALIRPPSSSAARQAARRKRQEGSQMTRPALLALWLSASLAAPLPGFVSVASAENLEVVGTGDGIPVFKALGAAFSTKKRDVTVIVPPSIHSSGGIREVGTDRAVLGRIARPLKKDEEALQLRVVPVFRVPAVFYTHPSVGIKSLSTEQLAGLFSGVVQNWREVGGPDLRVKIVRREEIDSTLAVLRDTLPGWKELKFNPDRSKLATSTQDAFASVRTVPGAIGFGPYTTDLGGSGLEVIAINGIAPTETQYPSAVTLSLIYRDTTVTKAARDFIDFVFTPAGHKAIIENGAVPVMREGRAPAT
jgi:phosphate transport system substrate-binding protein